MIDFLNAFYQVYCADEYIYVFICIFLISGLNLMRIQFLLDLRFCQGVLLIQLFPPVNLFVCNTVSSEMMCNFFLNFYMKFGFNKHQGERLFEQNCFYARNRVNGTFFEISILNFFLNLFMKFFGYCTCQALNSGWKWRFCISKGISHYSQNEVKESFLVPKSILLGSWICGPKINIFNILFKSVN